MTTFFCHTISQDFERFIRLFLFILTVTLILTAITSYGQIVTDTAKVKQQNNDTIKDVDSETWDHFVLGLRAVCGIQKSFYTECGLSLQRYFFQGKPATVAASTYYICFEWTPTTSGDTKKNIYGYKVGYEWAYNLAVCELDIKYLTNNEKEDIMITPKMGIGVGTLCMLYGYNFSTKKYPFSNIGKHQFSLVFNSNILFKKKNK